MRGCGIFWNGESERGRGEVKGQGRVSGVISV